MEAESAALAASGATRPVGLMVPETWTQAGDRVVRFLVRDGDGSSAGEELRLSQQELTAARAAQDELAGSGTEAMWRTRLRRVLLAGPGTAEELRLLLAESDPDANDRGASVHNSNSGGVQNGPVFQAPHCCGLTFCRPGAVPPGQSAGAV